VKQSREWQIFQWYDGITPRYHFLLSNMLRHNSGFDVKELNQPGCFVIKVSPL